MGRVDRLLSAKEAAGVLGRSEALLRKCMSKDMPVLRQAGAG